MPSPSLTLFGLTNSIGEHLNDNPAAVSTPIPDEWVNRLIRYPGAIAMRLRVARLRLTGMTIGRKCWICRVRAPRNPWDIAIGDGVALDDFVVLLTTGLRTGQPRLTIGAGTYVNRFTMFDASERIELGRNCLIGPFCYITDHDHGRVWGPSVREELVGSPVSIGDEVWIGAGVIVLKGVRVGNGAMIGAGSVVTHSVAPFSKVAGVPARALGCKAESAR